MGIGRLWAVIGVTFLAQAHTTYVHIFIHGTTVPGLLLLSQKEKPEGSRLGEQFVSLVEKSRNDERFYDDSIMLEPGLVPVSSLLINQCRAQQLDSYQSRKAAVQAITAYDDLINNHKDYYYYFTYGWSGLLSDDCRKKESEKLYKELVVLRTKIQERTGQVPQFILHAHSHGGGLVLYIALQEEINKQGLSIEQVFLYETPIQIETAQYCLNSCFKNMVLFYSEGDTVQIADCISTKGKSCRTFSELVSLEQARNRIHEILVKCGGDSTVLRHRAYFIFDAYHENLSALYRIVLGKNEAIDFLNPLPFVILSPIVMNLLQSVPPRKKHATQCELDVQVGPCSCNLQLMVLNQCQRCSPNVWQAISDIKKRVAATWAPYAKTSDVKKIFWLGQHLITRS